MLEKMMENLKSKHTNLEEEFSDKIKVYLQDYIKYLKKYGGGCGPIGKNAYLSLWTYHDINELNEGYGILEYLSDFVAIGSDGGDTAYGINSKNEYCQVSFTDLEESEIKIIADSFENFVEYLNNM